MSQVRFIQADLIEHGLGDTVYLRNDTEQREGFVTGIHLRGTGYTYSVSWGDRSETHHYPFELSTDKEFSPTHKP